MIGCWCIGQPRDGEALDPAIEDCNWDPELWILPERPSQIRLGFFWYIAKRGREQLEHESAWSCVVRLDNAEHQGVPLPSDFAPEVAAVLEADAKDQGAVSADLSGSVCRQYSNDASQPGAPDQDIPPDADHAAPEEPLQEPAPERDTTSGGDATDAPRRCLCPPEDWRANRERALANNCPYWIQHVADAASVLLRHAYELSIGAECRFAGYRSQTGSPEPTEETDLTECIVKFEWLFGAPARS